MGSAYQKVTSFIISHPASFFSTLFAFLNTWSLIDGIMKLLESKIDKHNYVEADIIQTHGKIKKNTQDYEYQHFHW